MTVVVEQQGTERVLVAVVPGEQGRVQVVPVVDPEDLL
jgi:hypothetical protein